LINKYYKREKLNSQYKAEFLIFIVSITWGLSFPLVKIGLDYSSPIFYVFVRFLLTTLIFCIIFYKDLKRISFSDFKYGAFIGLFLFAGYVTQTIALKYTSASNTAFITGTNIVFLPFVQMLIIRVAPKTENIFGIIIVLIGLYFLTDLQNMSFNKGDYFALLCSLSYAFYIVYLDKYTRIKDFKSLIFGMFLSTTIYALFSSFIIEGAIYNEIRFEFVTPLIAGIIINTIFANYLGLFISIKYQKDTTPVRAGLIYNMEQIFAVFFAYIFISEIMTLRQIFGALIMFLGLLISEFYGIIKNSILNEKS
jgi:drug/metabolite transporter (DMT)-like permease